MTCERYRIDLTALLYGDLPREAAAALEKHLEACAGCRDELRDLKSAALSLERTPLSPRESEVDWEAFAAATVQRARGYKAGRAARQAAGGWSLAELWRQPIHLTPAWASVAGALLLVVGVAVGTYGALSLLGPEPIQEMPPQVILVPAPEVAARLPQRMFDGIEAHTARAGTERYIADSRALLLSLLASPIRCDKETVDIKDERSRSLQLIRRQRLIADQLEKLPLARAQDVCRDLEQLLLEVIALSDCARAEQILELRDLVERRQLLLRMDLLADEMARSAPRNV
jgi:anti-sigma factor RsiW